jgi:NAD-dependent deacetylase
MRKPEIFYDFYKTTMIYEDAEPNEAHKALARLEKMGKLKAVVTQNIDGLHQKAGSEKVYELHGSVLRNYCMKCRKPYSLADIMAQEGVPRCPECGGMIKPDVVLYEEGLDDWQIRQSVKAISEADVLIVGGTSLNVYPAAGLINYYRGNKLVLVNLSETPYDSYADLVIHDRIGEVFDQI